MEELDPRAAFRAALTVDDSLIRTTARDDIASLATHVTRELDAKLADEVADVALDKLARKAGLPPHMLGLFFEFLANDPELQDRFAAHVAAKRITE